MLHYNAISLNGADIRLILKSFIATNDIKNYNSDK